MPKKSRQALTEQLASVTRSFQSLIDAFEKGGETEGAAHTFLHQLKWANIHMQEALLVLAGVDGGTAELPEEMTRAQPPVSSPAKSRPASPPDIDLSEGLRGHTQSISIAEILGFIASLRKRGTLVVHGENESYLIELKEGAVVYAQGDNAPEGLLLGEILVAQGAITRNALAEFLERSPSGAKVLGAGLLDEGLISGEALCIALAYQIQHLFHRLYAEEDATYQFEEEVHKIDSEDVRLNVQKLLLESARCLDEEEEREAD